MPEENPKESRDRTDWVEFCARLGGALGFNQVQIRWRLLRLRQRLQRTRRRAEQRALHIGYAHKTCQECGHVVDRSERVCPQCGSRVSSRVMQVIERIGLTLPSMVTVSSLLGLCIVGVYARMLYAGGIGALFGFPSDVLYRFGAHFPPAVWAGEWWRLGSAVFLHVGLWHLGFNLLALSQIGPAVEEVYGRGRMLSFFMLTGVVANLGSEVFGLRGVSAGASGALMGLMGVVAGWGHRDGTTVGRSLRNRMLQWAAYTMVFGFFIHADNAAHGVGFASGAVLGYFIKPVWLRLPGGRTVGVLLGLLGLAAAAGSVFCAVWPMPSSALPALAPGVARANRAMVTRTIREGCRLYRAGRVNEARQALRKLDLEFADNDVLPGQGLDEMCRADEDARRQCRRFRKEGISGVLPPEAAQNPVLRRAAEEGWRERCADERDRIEDGGRPAGPASDAGQDAINARD
jgi:rhomboid protease GluP